MLAELSESHPIQIFIRPPEPRDAAGIAESVIESLDDLTPWMPWASEHYGLVDAMGWIDRQATAREEGTAFEFLIVDADGRILGACGINQVSSIHRYANLGYWIRSSAAGRGVAPRAVALLREWVFANTDMKRLEIVVARGNRRSERVAEKAGAGREGLLRARLLIRGDFYDATMFSLVKPEVPSC